MSTPSSLPPPLKPLLSKHLGLTERWHSYPGQLATIKKRAIQTAAQATAGCANGDTKFEHPPSRYRRNRPNSFRSGILPVSHLNGIFCRHRFLQVWQTGQLQEQGGGGVPPTHGPRHKHTEGGRTLGRPLSNVGLCCKNYFAASASLRLFTKSWQLSTCDCCSDSSWRTGRGSSLSSASLYAFLAASSPCSAVSSSE